MNVRVPVVSRLHAKFALDSGRLFIEFSHGRLEKPWIYKADELIGRYFATNIKGVAKWTEELILDIVTGEDLHGLGIDPAYKIKCWIELTPEEAKKSHDASP